MVLVSTYSSWITTEDWDLDMRREVRSAVSVSVTFPISWDLLGLGQHWVTQSMLYSHRFVATIEHFPISTCPPFIHFTITIFSLHSVFRQYFVFFGVGLSFIHSPSMIKKHHQHQEYLRGRKQPTCHGKWLISKWFRDIYWVSSLATKRHQIYLFSVEFIVSLLAAFLVIILIFSDHQRFKGHKTENLMSSQNLSNASRNQPQDIK